MAKVKKGDESETQRQYIFNCAGCDQEHTFNDGLWSWNNDYEKPTIEGSYLIHGYRFDENRNSVPLVCHSHIKDGMIEYLTDCTHNLAGQTIELPEI